MTQGEMIHYAIEEGFAAAAIVDTKELAGIKGSNPANIYLTSKNIYCLTKNRVHKFV